ncbi:MAG: MCP four helix bundle domain-containing protein [candidate division Zixibacteria bacterium]|nr:MCP four helix bundle domain-containing protein [candidate division Zixibacteria bacterium]
MDGKSASRGPVVDFLWQYKFFGAFLVIGLVAIGVGAFLVRDIRQAMTEAQQIYARSVRGLDLIGDLQYQTQEARQSIIYALTTVDRRTQADYLQQSRDADTEVERILHEHNALLREQIEIRASDTFDRDWRLFQKVRDEVIRLIQEGNTPQAVRLDLSAGIGSFDAVTEDITQIKKLCDTSRPNSAW